MKILFWLLLAVMFLVGLNHVRLHFIDYPVYAAAAEKILSGQSANLYDVERTRSDLYFFYAYFYAVVFIPFVLVGNTLGKIAFLLVFFLSYIKILRFSVQKAMGMNQIDNKKAWYVIAVLSIILSIYALNDAFMNANIGIILLALCLFAYEWQDNKPLPSGISLGLAITFKIYPLIILCYFVWSRKWKVVLWSLLSVIVLYLGVPLLFCGFETGIKLMVNQFTMLSQYDQIWGYGGTVFQNIHATLIRYFSLLGISDSTTLKISMWGSSFVVIGFFLKSFLWPPRPLPHDLKEKMFLLTLTLVPLLVPISWYNMALFYVPMISFLLTKALYQKHKPSQIALLIYFIFFCLTTPDIIGRLLNDKLEFYGIPFLGVLALVVILMMDILQNHREFFFGFKRK